MTGALNEPNVFTVWDTILYSAKGHINIILTCFRLECPVLEQNNHIEICVEIHLMLKKEQI